LAINISKPEADVKSKKRGKPNVLDSPYGVQRRNHFFSNALTLSGFRKFSGIGSVTLPIVAHSVPRTSAVTKPTVH
jgi:hypothetical protein